MIEGGGQQKSASLYEALFSSAMRARWRGNIHHVHHLHPLSPPVTFSLLWELAGFEKL